MLGEKQARIKFTTIHSLLARGGAQIVAICPGFWSTYLKAATLPVTKRGLGSLLKGRHWHQCRTRDHYRQWCLHSAINLYAQLRGYSRVHGSLGPSVASGERQQGTAFPPLTIEKGCVCKWTKLLAVAAQRAYALSLLELRLVNAEQGDGDAPPLEDLLAQARGAEQVPDRLPAR